MEVFPQAMTTLQQILEDFDVSQRQIAEILELPRGRVSLLASGQAAPTRLEQFALDSLSAKLRNNELSVKATRPQRTGQPVGALAASLEGDKWTKVTARLGLPWLASTLERTTYRGFHEAVVARGGKREVGTMQKYSYPLGVINDAMQEASELLARPVPPLAALVCNRLSHLPSAGINPYLQEYLDATDRSALARRIVRGEDAPRDIIDLIHQEISDYPDWDGVVRAVGLTGDPAEDM
jgi:predicted XRE-type DNA-binding protein